MVFFQPNICLNKKYLVSEYWWTTWQTHDQEMMILILRKEKHSGNIGDESIHLQEQSLIEQTDATVIKSRKDTVILILVAEKDMSCIASSQQSFLSNALTPLLTHRPNCRKVVNSVKFISSSTQPQPQGDSHEIPRYACHKHLTIY